MATKSKPKISAEDKVTIDFVSDKKKGMKESEYRKRFDVLVNEVKNNLVNTKVTYGNKLYENNTWGQMVTYTKTANGNTDMNIYPTKVGSNQSQSSVPQSQEPIGFSKILVATSVLGGKMPDSQVFSDSQVYTKTMYELWKKTWLNRFGNGMNTLVASYQNLFTYGWCAWRIYPRTIQVKRNGVDKIIFSDIYREPMHPERTWMGLGFTNFDTFSQFEWYYEKDIATSLFLEMYPAAIDVKAQLDYCGNPQANQDTSVSNEAKTENPNKSKDFVTIGYYENMLTNRFIVVCGNMVIYDGELPNDDSFGSIVYARCFAKDMNDPHGVGLYEMMRGNTAIYTYINSLNGRQVEAEIEPLIFGTQVQNGTATYRRGAGIVNPKTPGTTLDVVNTNGNVSQGIQFANQQKADIEENTGVNNIVAGSSSENTLGSTVILKEAALNRLVIPRNSVVDALNMDALIGNSWMKQTYSVDKVFMVESADQAKEFQKQNPDYFTEMKPIMDGDVFKGFAIAASPNLRLNFDFTESGQLKENVPTRRVSAKALFDQLHAHGHVSPYINFQIDPTSMLLPSQEIQKQQYATNYPVITNSITQIFALRNTDVDAAQSQLMAFEQYLKEMRLDVYDYISKDDYDQIMSKKPSDAQVAAQKAQQENAAPQGKSPAESLNYKDAPEDIKRQIEAQAGLKPSTAGPMDGMVQAPQAGQGQPSDMPPGQQMMPGNRHPLQPINAASMRKPQGALGSSGDASLGYAAAMPFTPNK